MNTLNGKMTKFVHLISVGWTIVSGFYKTPLNHLLGWGGEGGGGGGGGGGEENQLKLEGIGST